MAPQDGWGELPECATDCFLGGLKDTGCEEGDTACLCEDGNWDILGEAFDGCKGCSGNDLWRLAASFKAMCDDQDSPSSTAEPAPSPTLFIAHDQPTTTDSSTSTSLTFVPIASHTPSLDTSELKPRDNGIPTSTIIGMAVGFAVAALLIVGLIFFYLRERRRRKSWEWTTEDKRESKLSSRLSLPGKRASKPSTTAASNSKRGSSVQVLEKGGWRPTGTTTMPPP